MTEPAPSPPTLEQVERWHSDFLTHLRGLAPATVKYRCTAFGLQAEADGVALTLRMQGGGTATIGLDPAQVLYLIEGLRAAGQVGGWLDADSAVIVQSPRGSDRWRPQS